MNNTIEQLLASAISKLQADGRLPEGLDTDTPTERAKDFTHGDIATNIALRLAKPAKQKPRDIAQWVIEHLPDSDLVGETAVAGPGFINFFFAHDWLAAEVERIANDDRSGVPPTEQPLKVVVDYSAPNVAKEMHVGHIRSTIIGDTIARTLEFLGHTVVRANHIGDWGTQFGMLIARLEELQTATDGATDQALSDLEVFYRESKLRYDSDPVFAEKARSYVVRLQGGDEWCLNQWQTLVDITMTQNQLCYDRLGVTLSRDDTMGESLYNPLLPGVVEDLLARGIAVEDNGAIVVFLSEYKTKDGDPMGVIVRKKDGGYLYTTTDIACIKYRYEQLHAQRNIYCVDTRQAQHLQQAWTIARLAGYLPDEVTTEHTAFGMMLGKDGKPFKTREGGTIKLTDLLDEAHERAARLIREKNPDIEEKALAQLAEDVGIGAVKYADLSKNRHTDYIFDWDIMLAFEGNTAPYLQYANTRILSLLNRAEPIGEQVSRVTLRHEHELLLARQLMWFAATLEDLIAKGLPHLLCTYLYDLARQFTRFYENCPINKSDIDAETRHSRIALCKATSRVLETGLTLLGIGVPHEM